MRGVARIPDHGLAVRPVSSRAIPPFTAWDPPLHPSRHRGARALLHRAGGDPRDEVVEEEVVENCPGQPGDPPPRHQLTPIEDIATDQIGHDAERYRLDLLAVDEDEGIDEFLESEREGEHHDREDTRPAEW